ncbi:MAG TPA: helix-turn-helix transcriptional regulator [Conexibacter sp.]|jgi:transcriptional regulator with XRE-family HTH domain|nr:helix-turn-helix transcriptional regulator [Conexibacter sp.]
MQKQRIPREPRSAAHGTLGRAVREQRARFDLSQEALAFQAGLHRNYVGAIERGEINPTFSTLMRLARGIGIALSELILLYETRSGHVLPEPLVGAPAPRRRRR